MLPTEAAPMLGRTFAVTVVYRWVGLAVHLSTYRSQRLVFLA
jgi:hypothetical protein